MTERESITCPNPKCHLVQFRTASDLCRRCKQPTAPPSPELELPPEIEVPSEHIEGDLAHATQLALTARRGKMSQWKLAEKMNCPRTYISKIESGTSTPNMGSLDKFARAFGIPLWVLIQEIDTMRTMMSVAKIGASNDVARLDPDEVEVMASVLAETQSAVD